MAGNDPNRKSILTNEMMRRIIGVMAAKGCPRRQEERTMNYYTMTTERAEEIAQLAGLTTGQVRDYCLTDWPQGEEHQRWLDTAPVGEIAAWIDAGAAEAEAGAE